MNLGAKTHYCAGSGRVAGVEIFGRIVNMYVHREGKWVKVGTMCSNCGDHWIDGKAYSALVSRSPRTT